MTAERLGVDVISIDGFECAGHPGEDDVTLMVLLPATVDAVKIPVIASGGMADGRSLVAALALGADGVNMGTRFMATQEAAIHQNVKEAIVKNTERDTILTNRTLQEHLAGGPQRHLRGGGAASSRTSTKTIDDVRELVSGARGRANVLKGGDIDGGIWSAGQSQGLIHDIPTCKELVARIIKEAEDIIHARLDRMAGTLVAAE